MFAAAAAVAVADATDAADAAVRTDRKTHLLCALPPPYRLLGSLERMNVGHSMHHQWPSERGRVRSVSIDICEPTQERASRIETQNERACVCAT